MLEISLKTLKFLRLIIFALIYILVTNAEIYNLIVILFLSCTSFLLISYFRNSKNFLLYLSFINLTILIPLVLQNYFEIIIPPGYQYICISIIASNLFIAFRKDGIKNQKISDIFLNIFTASIAPFTYLAGPSATFEEVDNDKADPIGLPDLNSIKHSKVKLAVSGFLKLSLGCYLSTMNENIQFLIFNTENINLFNNFFLCILFGFYNFWKFYLLFDGASQLCKGFLSTIGINVMDNFNSPYLATFYNEIWSRWHLNITDRVRNYLFTPISLFCLRNFSGSNKLIQILAIELLPSGILFFIIGIWHGGKKVDFIFALVSLLLTFTSSLLSKNRNLKKILKESILLRQIFRYISISLFGLALGIYSIDLDNQTLQFDSWEIFKEFFPYFGICVLINIYYYYSSAKSSFQKNYFISQNIIYIKNGLILLELLVAIFIQYKFVLPFNSPTEFIYFGY